MNNDKIKEIALANGFKLKEQPNGEMDLNPYVYDFVGAVLRENQIELMLMFAETSAKFPFLGKESEGIDACIKNLRDATPKAVEKVEDRHPSLWRISNQ